MTSLHVLEGATRDGTFVPVTIGRSVTGRTVLSVDGVVAELDAGETLKLIIAASEALRVTDLNSARAAEL